MIKNVKKLVSLIAPRALRNFEIVKNNVRFVISVLDNIYTEGLRIKIRKKCTLRSPYCTHSAVRLLFAMEVLNPHRVKVGGVAAALEVTCFAFIIFVKMRCPGSFGA